MHQYLDIPSEKMKIIPLGVDHNFFKPSTHKELTRKQILSKLKIPNEKYFLHVSEYNFERKNQQRLLFRVGYAFQAEFTAGESCRYPDVSKIFK